MQCEDHLTFPISAERGLEPRTDMMSERNSRKVSTRLQLACEPCKIAKLKCDRTLPVCQQVRAPNSNDRAYVHLADRPRD